MMPVQKVDFTEDNWLALEILLHITHLKFTQIPNRLSENLLAQVAILCDKYDCAHLVKPWLAGWLSVIESDTKPQTGGGRNLFIAWVFGREKTFKTLVPLLVRETYINNRGQLSDIYGRPCFEPMPPGLLGMYHLSA